MPESYQLRRQDTGRSRHCFVAHANVRDDGGPPAAAVYKRGAASATRPVSSRSIRSRAYYPKARAAFFFIFSRRASAT